MPTRRRLTERQYWNLKQFASRRIETVPYDEGSAAYVFSPTESELELLHLPRGKSSGAIAPTPSTCEPRRDAEPPRDIRDLVVCQLTDDHRLRSIALKDMFAEEAAKSPKEEFAADPKLEAAVLFHGLLAFGRFVEELKSALADDPRYQQLLRDDSPSRIPEKMFLFPIFSVLDNGDVIIRFSVNRRVVAVHFSKASWASLTKHGA